MREIVPQLPAELDAVVAHCLEKDRNARFASVAELARALSPHASAEGRMSIDRVARALGVSATAETIAGPRAMPLPPVPTLTPVPTAPGVKAEGRSSSTLMEASMPKRAGASSSRKWAAIGGVALAIALVAVAGVTALRARPTAVPAPAAAIAPEVVEVATAPAASARTAVPIAHEPSSVIDAGISLAAPGPFAPIERHPSTSPPPPASETKSPPAPHVAHSPPHSASSAPAPSASAAASKTSKPTYDVLDQRN
jgi:serine/threonine-protein kinase